MTKNQYENIVSETIKKSSDKGELDTVRDILKNLGIGFPKGNVKEITDALETEDFMGWEKCSNKVAGEALENGTPVIAVSCGKVFVVTGDRSATDISEKGVVNQEELKNVPGVQLYMYSGETTDEPGDFPHAPHFNSDVYIYNSITGKYMRASGESLVMASGPISPTDDSCKWRISYRSGSDDCYISPVSDPSKRLCVDGNGNVYLENPNLYMLTLRWEVLMTNIYGDDFLIRNIYTSGYLTSANATPCMNATNTILSEWNICDISGLTEAALTMNCNINQKYYMNDFNIINWGCPVCACCDVASFYHGSAYTLADMADAEVYIPCQPGDPTGESGSAWCYFYNAPSAYFNEYVVTTEEQEQARQAIKEEILAGRPVVVKIGVGGYEHYVVAYGFENNAASNSDIKILDPCNLHPSITHPIYGIPASEDAGGQTITLAASMAEQGGYHNNVTYSILSLLKTSPKV